VLKDKIAFGDLHSSLTVLPACESKESKTQTPVTTTNEAVAAKRSLNWAEIASQRSG
jgi:hypothetical protein